MTVVDAVMVSHVLETSAGRKGGLVDFARDNQFVLAFVFSALPIKSPAIKRISDPSLDCGNVIDLRLFRRQYAFRVIDDSLPDVLIG